MYMYKCVHTCMHVCSHEPKLSGELGYKSLWGCLPLSLSETCLSTL